MSVATTVGFSCDNPTYAREPDDLVSTGRTFEWCLKHGFFDEKQKGKQKYYPVDQKERTIQLAVRDRTSVDFTFLVSCETGPDNPQVACGRNLLMSARAPVCRDQPDDGTCVS